MIRPINFIVIFYIFSPADAKKDAKTKMKKTGINIKCRHCRGIFADCCKILQCCTKCFNLLFSSQARPKYDKKKCGNCGRRFASENACLSHLANCPLPNYIKKMFANNGPFDVAKLFS